jgi:hypothetical protein
MLEGMGGGCATDVRHLLLREALDARLEDSFRSGEIDAHELAAQHNNPPLPLRAGKREGERVDRRPAVRERVVGVGSATIAKRLPGSLGCLGRIVHLVSEVQVHEAVRARRAGVEVVADGDARDLDSARELGDVRRRFQLHAHLTHRAHLMLRCRARRAAAVAAAAVAAAAAAASRTATATATATAATAAPTT